MDIDMRVEVTSMSVNGRCAVPTKSIKVTSSESDSLCCAPLTETPLSVGDVSELAAVMAALSDPVRLRLLSLVASEGEVCSCNLEGPLGKSQPTISHHTRILSDAGLIVGEKRGKWTWWRTAPERLETIRRVLGGR
jgi:ArsR family transcriptional regulator, arsenate/arsenite/antimonite-responsive transcriptional repressor